MSFLKNPVIVRQKVANEPYNRLIAGSTDKESIYFKVVCEYWFKMESTSKRLEKSQYFTYLLILLGSLCIQDAADVMLLLSNNIRDPWDRYQSCLNCGEQLVRKAIQDAFSVKPAEIKASMQYTGDIALSCEKFKKRYPKYFIQPKPLTVRQIISQFRRIADVLGNKANDERATVIRSLLLAGTALENRYIVRLLVGKNRLGFYRKTMLFALADYLCFKRLKFKFDSSYDVTEQLNEIWAKIADYYVSNRTIDDVDGDEDEYDSDAENDVDYGSMSVDDILDFAKNVSSSELSGNVRQQSYYLVLKAFAKVPSMPQILLKIDDLAKLGITPFVPMLPMLAKPASTYSELFEQGYEFYTEYKYDGFRAYIHYNGEYLYIYSRSYENMSERFPDVLESVQTAILQPTSFVVDGEIVPISDSGEILPFQMLSRRLKIYDSSQEASKIRFFCFDIMMLDSVDLLDVPFAARRRLLELSFQYAALFQLSTQRYCKCYNDIEQFLAEAVAHKTEGLIVKTKMSKYAPDRRSRHWIKLKKDYLDEVGDTIDLVPVAGWFGRGKRAGIIGSYLLACKNGDLFQTVTCAGTGMSDEFLASQTWEKLERCPRAVQVTERYTGPNAPDFWIDPDSSRVWEIKVANLSISKMHTCHWKNGEGIAARLPRLIRERTDKTPLQCSTAYFIYERFAAYPDRCDGEEPSEPGMQSSSYSYEDSV